MTPKVSILIRSMDRDSLTRAIASAAAQTYPSVEIVVVAASGMSHSKVPSMWAERPVRFITGTTPLLRADAGNAAIDAATGEWLNFLDDDDELLPQHIQTLLEGVGQTHANRVIYSRSEVVDEAGRTSTFGKAHHPIDLLLRSQFCIHSAMFHRSLLVDGVRFDPALPVHEDLDFWIQCAQHTDFRFVDQHTNKWHAFIGSSGAGGGANFDATSTSSSQRRLQAKWIRLIPEWTRTLAVGEVIERGQAAIKAGHSALAVALLEHALVRAPTDVNALNLAGVANLRAGNATRAVDLFTKSVQIHPTHPGLVENLELARRALTRSARLSTGSINLAKE